jgi:hypothetical protein
VALPVRGQSSTMEHRRLEIARKLALKEFASNEVSGGVDDVSVGSSASTALPPHKTADIICNPKYTGIFSHKIERSYVTQINMSSISFELEKAMRHPSITLHALVNMMRKMLKVRDILQC